MAKTASPAGSWQSPITAKEIAQSGISFSEIIIDSGQLYWLEARPAEQGRTVIVKMTDKGPVDCIPKEFSARTLVNSYGGGAYHVNEGKIYFSNYVLKSDVDNDQRLYVGICGESPRLLTGTTTDRYADGDVMPDGTHMIIVKEDSSHKLHDQSRQSLVSINLESGAQNQLLDGQDFYAAPRISPDGKRLAWISWNYPAMPWDSTALFTADIGTDQSLKNVRQVSSNIEQSVLQPTWSPDGKLYYVTDLNNWWNIHVEGSTDPVHKSKSEFTTPPWSLATSQFAFIDEKSILCTKTENGLWTLGVIDIPTRSFRPIETPFTSIHYVKCDGRTGYFVGGDSKSPESLVKIDTTNEKCEVLKSSWTSSADTLKKFTDFFSEAQTIQFENSGNGITQAFYYPPVNIDFELPEGELPPLIIKSHGGPTAMTESVLDLSVQYFTSRGFAVVDVNYRGSTGFGRDFRLSLYTNWGIYDSDDCAAAAKYLMAQSMVDGSRIVARGGSSGGYVTLCLLAYYPLLKAGASYYGISDLEMIVKNSDRLEAHYPYRLIGPYPEDRKTYRERSPLNFAMNFKAATVFFQGKEDPVVPIEQTKKMVAALLSNKIPVASEYYANEQHGFRIAVDIEDSLEKELYFYSCILKFKPADKLHKIEIHNWEGHN